MNKVTSLLAGAVLAGTAAMTPVQDADAFFGSGWGGGPWGWGGGPWGWGGP